MLMAPYGQGIFEFIRVCYADPNRSDAVKRAAVGTLGKRCAFVCCVCLCVCSVCGVCVYMCVCAPVCMCAVNFIISL